ncbi:hypothetical protein C8Q78DRAFT_406812 [Trametes maxima]|nr:hypothetical protein C8Q78DRAFT_406812 [Trametes maxima]
MIQTRHYTQASLPPQVQETRSHHRLVQITLRWYRFLDSSSGFEAQESALSALRAANHLHNADTNQDLFPLTDAPSAENSQTTVIRAISPSSASSPAPVLGTTFIMTEDVADSDIPRVLASGSQDTRGGTDAEHLPGATLADDLYSEPRSLVVDGSLQDSSQTASNSARLGHSWLPQSSFTDVPEGETRRVADRDDTGIPHPSECMDIGLASSPQSLPLNASDGDDTSLPHAQDARRPLDVTIANSAHAYRETEGEGASSEPGLTPRNTATDPPHAVTNDIDRRARDIDSEQDASPLTNAPPAETSESIVVRTRSHAAAAPNISTSPSPPSAILDPAQAKNEPPPAGRDNTGDLDELALDSAPGGTNAQRPPVPAPQDSSPDRAPDAATSSSEDPPAQGARLSPSGTGGSIVGFAGDLVEESTNTGEGL